MYKTRFLTLCAAILKLYDQRCPLIFINSSNPSDFVLIAVKIRSKSVHEFEL